MATFLGNVLLTTLRPRLDNEQIDPGVVWRGDLMARVSLKRGHRTVVCDQL